jgi:hypothetical protein
MYLFVPITIKVGRGETLATNRVDNHDRLLEIVAWNIYLRLDYNEARESKLQLVFELKAFSYSLSVFLNFDFPSISGH